MKAILVVYLALTIVLAAHRCRAAVSDRDWMAPGDGLLTYDDVNQREWLDLSETILEKFPGTAYEDRYETIVAKLRWAESLKDSPWPKATT